MHFLNVISVIAFFIASQCNFVEGRFELRGAVDRNSEIQRIIAGAKINLGSASQDQLNDFKDNIPPCLKKSDKLFRSFAEPTIKGLSVITGKRKRSLDYEKRFFFGNDNANTNQKDINTVAGLIGQVVAKLTDEELVTIRKITESVANNGFFTRGPFLFALIQAAKLCATAEDVQRRNYFEHAISYNQPKFCPSVSWNPNGVTFSANITNGSLIADIFIDSNNTIYVTDYANHRILIWSNNNSNPTRIIHSNLLKPLSIFVTSNGDIYISNDNKKGQVDKLTLTSTTSIPVMYIDKICFDIFVDINDTLYCSIYETHQIVKKWLNGNAKTSSIAAGTDTRGNASNQLDSPIGIFVDINLDLYVADCANHRIQLFQSGQLNGTTVAGENSLTTTITLNRPTGVVLDYDKYLFIVDQNNHRIVRAGLYGFLCVVGCSGSEGLGANQLHGPRFLSFNSDGHIFVTDRYNHRIQKFLVATNSCDTSNPPSCDNSTHIGLFCNMSNSPCALLNPCQNNGTCHDNSLEPHGYLCLCPNGFNGARCQSDYRLCKPDTCWNNGTCDDTSSVSFVCLCHPDWKGSHCETKVNYCENVTCENNGVCRPLIGNYTCECLGDSYSGSYCEIVATKIKIYKIVSKSFAYIAIIALILVEAFVIIMDILKYYFGIDPTREHLEQIQRENRAKKRKPVIQRFIYVNSPPTTLPSES